MGDLAGAATFLSNRKYRYRPNTQPDVGNCWPCWCLGAVLRAWAWFRPGTEQCPLPCHANGFTLQQCKRARHAKGLFWFSFQTILFLPKEKISIEKSQSSIFWRWVGFNTTWLSYAVHGCVVERFSELLPPRDVKLCQLDPDCERPLMINSCSTSSFYGDEGILICQERIQASVARRLLHADWMEPKNKLLQQLGWPAVRVEDHGKALDLHPSSE